MAVNSDSSKWLDGQMEYELNKWYDWCYLPKMPTGNFKQYSYVLIVQKQDAYEATHHFMIPQVLEAVFVDGRGVFFRPIGEAQAIPVETISREPYKFMIVGGYCADIKET